MYLNHWSLVSSYNYVLRRRNIIYPNLGFIKQLIEFEIELYGCTSLKNVDEIDELQNGMLHDRSLSTLSCKLQKAFIPKKKQLAKFPILLSR